MKKFIFILLIILYLIKICIFYQENSFEFDEISVKNNAIIVTNTETFTNFKNEDEVLNLETINNLIYLNKKPYPSCGLIQDFLPYVQYKIIKNLGGQIQYQNNMDYIMLKKDNQILGYYFIPLNLIYGYVYQNNIFYEVKFTRFSKYILAIGEKCYEISK